MQNILLMKKMISIQKPLLKIVVRIPKIFCKFIIYVINQGIPRFHISLTC